MVGVVEGGEKLLPNNILATAKATQHSRKALLQNSTSRQT